MSDIKNRRLCINFGIKKTTRPFLLPPASAGGKEQTGTYRDFSPKAGESSGEAGRILIPGNRGFTLN
ncbi:MAG: hypothetical protein HGA37_09170 [Lentimicrobium sp.]|nr:hypothetical protein [Lentimicrobium sp.]